jgi:hypothetical protein
MMEAVSTFETSVIFYQTTLRNNPEGVTSLNLEVVWTTDVRSCIISVHC